jgi:hypothetical protein
LDASATMSASVIGFGPDADGVHDVARTRTANITTIGIGNPFPAWPLELEMAVNKKATNSLAACYIH